MGHLGVECQNGDQGRGAQYSQTASQPLAPGGGLGGLIPGQYVLQQFFLVFGIFFHTQQPAHRYGKQAAQRNQLFDFGQGRVRLPFVYGLPGYPQLFPQRLLGQAQFFALGGDALSGRHNKFSFLILKVILL